MTDTILHADGGDKGAPAAEANEASGEVTRIATGMRFTEGPIWHPYEQHLIFSDIPSSRMFRWTGEQGMSEFRSPSNMANGNAYDRSGRILTCEHRTSRVVRADADGVVRVVASHWQGREFNSPNDIIVAGDGTIYFTDPPFGRLLKPFGGERPIPQDVNGVYRIDPAGRLDLIFADFDLPNGLCLSPDGKRLFIADSAHCHLRMFEVANDGTFHGGSAWADVPSEGHAVPDGVKADSAGNVYCSGAGGIHVFAPDGTRTGHIAVPELVANFTFGGSDMKTLFITASRSLYAARVRVPGVPAF